MEEKKENLYIENQQNIIENANNFLKKNNKNDKKAFKKSSFSKFLATKKILNYLNYQIEKIDNITQDCEHNILKLEEKLMRHSYNNTYIFFRDNRYLATEYYECNKLEELYNLYCNWCNKHYVNTLSNTEFNKFIKKTAKRFTRNIPQDKNISFDIVYSELCAYIMGSIDKGCLIEETAERALKYYINKHPNASNTLKNMVIIFAKNLQGFYLTKKELEEVYKDEQQ